ncbi:MAG: sulfatase-like hydrolase/transferase [Sedimentisphaerales bacterium]|nr:sulfatase-like hydrolase/transferase [Sedimentisphaerales bacterium]
MSEWTRREFLRYSIGSGISVGAIGLFTYDLRASDYTKGKKPNVLLIMTDTQRLDDMGAYGNPVIRTPHLDSLANSGTMFRNCHTQYPACMPARATIFTGRYPMAHGVWANGVQLPEKEITLAHLFAANGYRTGGAGKFHFQPHFPYRKNELPSMETHPEPYYGFQEFYLGEDGRSGEHHLWIKKNHPEYYDKPDDQIPIELHNSYWTASHTIDFIRRCNSKGEPFFAFCSFVDPHQSYNPPPPYSMIYKPQEMPDPVRRDGELEKSRFKSTAENGNMMNYTKRLKENRAQHYGEMTFIDDSVGRVLKTLDELKIRDNTLIVFVADHGDMLGDHWLWWKGPWHYAGCTNVPLFFNWTGMVKSGKIVKGMVQQTDVLPTICELTSLPIPPGVQGKSLKDVLTQDTDETPYDYVYIESVSSGAYAPDYLDGSGRRRQTEPGHTVDTVTIRSRKWRFTVFTGADDGELYDLEKDPDEFNNVFHDPDFASIRSELMTILLDRLSRTRDPLPAKTRPY